MKKALIFCLSLVASAYAQKPILYVVPPGPFKGATAIIIHTPDSVRIAYKKAAQSLLSAGYMLDKTDKELGYSNTKPKAIDTAYALALQVNAVESDSGTDIIFGGQFTWASAITIVAKTDKREMPVTYTNGGNTPVRKMWDEMVRVARLAYPSATISYR